MDKFFNLDKSAETRRTLHTHTHTHTHTDKPCWLNFSQFILIPIFIFCSAPVFAVDINEGDSATCDTNVLNTDTGPVNLRAEYEAETINLKWYNENTRVTVPNASNSCTYDTAINLPTNPTKPGYTFKGWKVIPGTRIQYIESTAGQWINTGFKFTGNIVKYDLIYNAPNPTQYMSLFGASDANTSWSGINHYVSTTSNHLYIGTNGSINSTQETPGTTYTYSLTVDRNNNTWEISKNGSRYSGTFSGTVTSTCNIALFAHNMCGLGLAQTASYKNYGFKITQDGVLVRDMIPIKDYNGVVCMYDFVTKQIFYNAGTGNFIAGPDL